MQVISKVHPIRKKPIPIEVPFTSHKTLNSNTLISIKHRKFGRQKGTALFDSPKDKFLSM